MDTPEESQVAATERVQSKILVTDLPKFDLESYISNYTGPTKLLRLEKITRSCPGLAIDALRIAIPETKQTKNTEFHINLTSLLYELDKVDPIGVTDVNWVEGKKKENKREVERLENELKGYKNNLIKESIRMGQEDLGQHYSDMGDYDNAQKSYQKMREYCNTIKQAADMTLKIIYTSILSSQWLKAQSFCHKLFIPSTKPEEGSKYNAVLQVSLGLACLGNKDYKAAAEAFLRITGYHSQGFVVSGIDFSTQVATPNDIAIYAGLCALATMDRDQLRSKFIDNREFSPLLELEPHIRRAITSFCDAKYFACLDILDSYRSDYLLDIYLGSHVDRIYNMIRTKSIMQYFIPFSHVRISDLAAIFPPRNTNGETNSPATQDPQQIMMKELVGMIRSGDLDARIDAEHNLLLACTHDLHAETNAAVIQTALDIEASLKLKLHKLNLRLADMELRDVKGDGK